MALLNKTPFSKDNIGIIIINYNNWADTKETLESINQSTFKNFSVLLIDNNSKDQESLALKLAKLHLKYPHWLKRNKKNLGFAKAVNRGLNFFYKRGYKYYLLLNNDVLVSPSFLDCLVKEYKNLPPGSILSPLIKHRVSSLTLYGGEGYLTPLIALARHRNYLHQPKWGIKKVQFVSGCSILFDYNLLQDNLRFDEHFFLYLEDVDFCLQAAKKGHYSYLTSRCLVFHKQSRSFKKSTTKLKYSFPSNLRFAWKHYSLFSPIWAIFLPFFYLKLYVHWSLRELKKKALKLLSNTKKLF